MTPSRRAAFLATFVVALFIVIFAAHAAPSAVGSPNAVLTTQAYGCNYNYVVNKTAHGQTHIDVCNEEDTGFFTNRSHTQFTCTTSDGITRQPCNLSFDHQRLWYNATKADDRTGNWSGIPDNLSSVYFNGGWHSQTTAFVHSDVGDSGGTICTRYRSTQGTLNCTTGGPFSGQSAHPPLP